MRAMLRTRRKHVFELLDGISFLLRCYMEIRFLKVGFILDLASDGGARRMPRSP